MGRRYIGDGEQAQEICRQITQEKKRIQVLGIADHFTYYQQELIDLLEEKVNL